MYTFVQKPLHFPCFKMKSLKFVHQTLLSNNEYSLLVTQNGWVFSCLPWKFTVNFFCCDMFKTSVRTNSNRYKTIQFGFSRNMNLFDQIIQPVLSYCVDLIVFSRSRPYAIS